MRWSWLYFHHPFSSNQMPKNQPPSSMQKKPFSPFFSNVLRLLPSFLPFFIFLFLSYFILPPLKLSSTLFTHKHPFWSRNLLAKRWDSLVLVIILHLVAVGDFFFFLYEDDVVWCLLGDLKLIYPTQNHDFSKNPMLSVLPSCTDHHPALKFEWNYF